MNPEITQFDIIQSKLLHIKHIYTDIEPTIGFVFPVNKIDREDSGKK
jgi:hypothetical protein